MVMGRSFCFLIAGLTLVQKLLLFQFLLLLSWTFRIKRLHLAFLVCSKLRQMPYEQDQFPAVVIFSLRPPGRHSGKPNAVVDDVVDLSIREVLRGGQPHIRHFGIKILSDLGLSDSVIAVANRAMIGEVSSRFSKNFGSWWERIDRVALRCRNRQPPRSLSDVSFQR